MKSFSYHPSDTKLEYDVYFLGKRLELSSISKNIINSSKRYIFIAENNLPQHYLQIIREKTGFTDAPVVYVDPSRKTIDEVVSIWDKMVQSVPDTAIVLGGGTIGDISGFVCGTYQRGIERIYFPTTILSMVDASLGGKSGIDHGDVKNSVGVVQYPIATINYLPFLATLPREEYVSGFGEIIKAAVIYDKKFFYELIEDQNSLKNFSEGNNKVLNIIYKSAKIKADICEEPTNKKVRLLYGHAVGNAIEKFSQNKLKHGNCVAIGMEIEGAIACVLGIWNAKDWKEQHDLMVDYKLPTMLPPYIQISELLKKMLLYKKLVDKEHYLFSVPEEIGKIYNQESSCVVKIKKSEIVDLLEKTFHFISTYVRH